VLLQQLLRHLLRKDKGFRVVDTHAGTGLYELQSPQALKKREFEHGIGRLWTRSDAPPAVADYLEQVRALNDSGALQRYPGSPWLMLAMLRPQDQLRLFELHPAEHSALLALLGKRRGVQVQHADGFTALKGQLPPPTRRALVLIDPSYEGQADYARVLDTVRDALGRFAGGMLMVWYPVVGKPGAADMVQRLKALAPRGWLHAQLVVQPLDALGFGLAGSGVLVLNPPHTLHAQLQTALPWLVQALGRTPEARHLLEQQAA
jgi:23S rRNA (adenine2030-N6)-methyltransferase